MSHHALAERKAGTAAHDSAFMPARTVLAGDHRANVSKRGDHYEVGIAGVFGTQEVFEVVRVLGESPLHQFLIGFPRGRLQALEAAYDPRSNQWFNVYGSEDRRPGEWGHWTGRGMNWNSMCAGCHNTRVRKNYDQSRDSYSTAMAEISVGCEACHGPLRQHNEWQQKFGRSDRKDPTVRELPRDRMIDNCGFCHARRGELAGDFKPGDDFFDDMRLEIPDFSETFYADGQVHEEDYEYAPFLGSRMHLRGVHCGDCHNPHSAKTILPGNWLCMRCHDGSNTNAPTVDPVGHSHHKVFGHDPNGVQTNLDLTSHQTATLVETGGECVNCHMPQTVYMQRHWRHDHGFTIPDPLLTKEAGVPNACNRCHTDKDANWALKWCSEWYGAKMERPDRQRALLIATSRKGNPTARFGLLAMLSTNEIGYWRAVAAGLLEPWSDDPQVRAGLLGGLNDSNALVRIECTRALEPAVQEPQIAQALAHVLNDPVRGARVAAAWALRANLAASSKAETELQHSLANSADQPVGQMQLGALALARGDAAGALAHYQKAVQWDPHSPVIRHDFAIVLSRLHRPTEALEQMQAACQMNPTNAEFQLSLALAWNEVGQTSNTIECLQSAVRLEPAFSTAWYNLGLVLDATGRSEEALDALVRAESADLFDRRAPYARATILARMGRRNEARKAAQRALEIDPRFEAARELLQTLDAARGGTN